MSESLQHILDRVRAPRVQITYDVETGDASEKKQLPFVVGILASLQGQTPSAYPLKQRPFIQIDRDNLEKVIESLAPSLSFSIPSPWGLETPLVASLTFRSLLDFHPHSLVEAVPSLKVRLIARTLLLDLNAKLDGSESLYRVLQEALKDQASFALLAQKESDAALKLLAQTSLTPEVQNTLIPAVQEMAARYSNSTLQEPHTVLAKQIQALDQELSLGMDAILHHPEFQALEASWRGLQQLVMNTETNAFLKLRLLPMTYDELVSDLERATEFDQSQLFKKIYEDEYGTFGGAPFSCFLIDFPFGRSAQDVKTLHLLSGVAAASHAPCFATAKPSLFDLEDFSHLPYPRDLEKIFESSECIAWNSFRETEDSRYIGLLLPRVLMRLPYGPDTLPVKSFHYRETVQGENNRDFCWGSPVYAFGQNLTRAFSLYGWTAAIRGVEGGGLVENLPSYTFETVHGDKMPKSCTEILITDRREAELSQLGFIALCQWKARDKAVFFGSQSTQKPKTYDQPDATANARLSARMTYLLNASRFAHYVKVMMREKLGSFLEAQDIENYLQSWLAQYVLLSDDASQELRAQYPLRAGTVLVEPVAENPDDAILYLRPHFQFEGLHASIRLVARITPNMLKS